LEKAADAFRTISEVADELDVPQHVLRFWESRFAQIKPMKRGGGRRYYRPEDVDLLRGIRHLLYGEGYTIRGVQRILRDQGTRFVQLVWHEGAELSSHRAADHDEPSGHQRMADDEEDVEFEGGSLNRHEPPMASAPVPRIDPDERRTRLGREEVRKLQAALRELTECRRIIDAVLQEGG